MANHNEQQICIDRIHSQAVCDGIGERMRDEMNRIQVQPSSLLDSLLARLPEIDDIAPSIVPEIAG